MSATMEQYCERLRNRRNEVMMTLEHVQREQAEVSENQEWIDRAAYENRRDLLDNLADWYANETARIDQALRRLAEGSYGKCLGCHESIDPRRLEMVPEATFCIACQEAREALSAP